ncbi:MAG: hypothetical protein DMG16_16260 [Acidobacteria bacterium]|nr:MAG: hypothetical protein DMG16_16260 [Acidobacteriota bacterium]
MSSVRALHSCHQKLKGPANSMFLGLFWTHRENRRHERLRYEKSGKEWKQSRLYP